MIPSSLLRVDGWNFIYDTASGICCQILLQSWVAWPSEIGLRRFETAVDEEGYLWAGAK